MKQILRAGVLVALPCLLLAVLFPACGSKSTPTTPASTDTPTPAVSATPSGTPTNTASPTLTGTPTKTATLTPSGTPSSTATTTPTPTVSSTPTITSTPVATHGFQSNNPSNYPTAVLPYYPLGIAVDSSRNLYVAAGSNSLYRYNSSGVSLALFTLSGLTQGGGVAVDNANGYLYVSDYSQNKVDRYVLSSGAASGSVTGQSGVAFNFGSDPAGLAVDASGHLFVGDYLNSDIQEFDNTGAPVTVYPLPNAPNRPLGLAADASSGYLFVTSSGGQVIKYLPPGGSPVTVVAAAVTFNPQPIAVDSSGNIYVGDTANQRVQVFTGGGTHLTNFGSLGTGNAQFSSSGGPQSLAVDSLGNILATDTYDNRIETFGP